MGAWVAEQRVKNKNRRPWTEGKQQTKEGGLKLMRVGKTNRGLLQTWMEEGFQFSDAECPNTSGKWQKYQNSRVEKVRWGKIGLWSPIAAQTSTMWLWPQFTARQAQHKNASRPGFYSSHQLWCAVMPLLHAFNNSSSNKSELIQSYPIVSTQTVSRYRFLSHNQNVKSMSTIHNHLQENEKVRMQELNPHLSVYFLEGFNFDFHSMTP